MSEPAVEQDNLWRYTAQPPMVLGVLDARAMLPFVLLLFHMRLWTFYVAMVSTGLFAVLQVWRITPIEAIKAVWLWVTTLGFRNNHIGHRTRRYPHDDA